MVQSQSLTLFDLTEDEETALDRCETTIERGLKTFYAVGNALVEIRDERLYRKAYGTFEDYCQERWGMSKTHANRLIASADTIDNLTPIGVIPDNEAQIRPLTRLEPDQQREAWQRAVETAPNGKVTAAHVEQVVRDIDIPRTPENTDLIGNGVDDVLDPPMEPAQLLDLPPAAHDAHDVRSPLMRVMGSSESPEWYTPQHVIDRVLKVFGGEIDLDPCSNSDDPVLANVRASRYFTQHTDGLSQPWCVRDYTRVYMNPPYGDEIPPWIDRLIEAYEDEEIGEAIALVPGRIDTAWFRPLWKYAICAVYGRLRFSGAENSAPFPSVIVYMGPNVELFKETFGDIGQCGVLT